MVETEMLDALVGKEELLVEIEEMIHRLDTEIDNIVDFECCWMDKQLAQTIGKVHMAQHAALEYLTQAREALLYMQD